MSASTSALEAIRSIRDRFYENTEDMSPDELKAFIAREADSARSELRKAVDSGKDQSDNSAT